MPGSTRRRRSPIAPGVEDYYKILEVRKNASQESIKQAYIRLVRLFPPETHPNEFQQIRRAYEILRDTTKRRQYDFTRKYGSDVEGLMEQALAQIEQGKLKKATQLLETILKIDSSFVSIYFLLAAVALMKNDEAELEAVLERAFQLAKNDDERAAFFSMKANMFASVGEPERALRVLDEAEETYPEQAEELADIRIEVYAGMERFEEAFNLASSQIPEPEFDKAEDISRFVTWMNMMIMSDKWQYVSKTKSRMRRFLRCVQTKDDMEVVLSIFHQESLEWEDAHEYRGALLFSEFCLTIEPKNETYIERRRHLETLQRMTNEYERLTMDSDMFPFVSYQAFRWYAEMIGDEDILESLAEKDIMEYIEEYADWHEEIASGILRLKKRYQTFYREFQEKCDTLFAEHATGLNREQRRRLR